LVVVVICGHPVTMAGKDSARPFSALSVIFLGITASFVSAQTVSAPKVNRHLFVFFFSFFFGRLFTTKRD
jgi:hypothetical protein